MDSIQEYPQNIHYLKNQYILLLLFIIYIKYFNFFFLLYLIYFLIYYNNFYIVFVKTKIFFCNIFIFEANFKV